MIQVQWNLFIIIITVILGAKISADCNREVAALQIYGVELLRT